MVAALAGIGRWAEQHAAHAGGGALARRVKGWAKGTGVPAVVYGKTGDRNEDLARGHVPDDVADPEPPARRMKLGYRSTSEREQVLTGRPMRKPVTDRKDCGLHGRGLSRASPETRRPVENRGRWFANRTL